MQLPAPVFLLSGPTPAAESAGTKRQNEREKFEGKGFHKEAQLI